MTACASGGVNSCRLVCELVMLRASRTLSCLYFPLYWKLGFFVSLASSVPNERQYLTFIVNDFSGGGIPIFA